jgi:hypothetical protein
LHFVFLGYFQRYGLKFLTIAPLLSGTSGLDLFLALAAALATLIIRLLVGRASQHSLLLLELGLGDSKLY